VAPTLCQASKVFNARAFQLSIISHSTGIHLNRRNLEPISINGGVSDGQGLVTFQTMTTPDLAIILAYLALMLGIGLYYRRYAAKGLEDFFLAGRSIRGWLNGVSYAAAMVSADAATAYGGLAVVTGVFVCWYGTPLRGPLELVDRCKWSRGALRPSDPRLSLS
jgi:hypothetical protein